METYRNPAVAGMFYPNNPDKLNRDVEGFINSAEKKSDKKPKFIVAPHAGYVYSGKIAGESYAETIKEQYDKIIVLGPSHRYRFKGLAESEDAFWSLPNGKIKIQALNHPQIERESRYHESEHCLEVQFPFLINLYPKASYSPILVSGAYGNAERLAEILFGFDTENTLWVISSDFNHVGPSFNHFPNQFGYGSGDAMDMQAIDHIVEGDTKGFIKFMEKTHATICGALPILISMYLIKKMNRSNLKFKSYDSSGNQTGDANSVGYASLYS